MSLEERLQEEIAAMEPELIAIRRQFHRHPELGEAEETTSRMIRDYLEKWEIPYQYPVAGNGIVALLSGERAEDAGSTVALRADIDALPLTEDPGRPYCSLNPGVMHACGHDAHITIALGVAKILKAHAGEWSGCVKFFFQPAEETVGGAEPMIREGCMENPHVDYVIGLHVMPTWEAGEVEYRYGKLNASTDEIHIRILGKGCHGAYPDAGTDAIVMAGAVIESLQSLVSRNISPLNQAVLTLGTIHGGTAGNIIAGQVDMTGTLRTTDPATRQFCWDAITRITEHTCLAYGGRGEAEITPGYAALINTPEMVDLLVETASAVVGPAHLHPKEAPSLGGEDFSFFLEKAPGVFWHLGCACREKGITAPLHSAQFDIDESCLKLGVRIQTLLALRLLSKLPGQEK